MKGIAFTDALAQAVHEGRKTVTRRLVKPQPPADADEVFLFDAEDARRQLGDGWEYAKSGLWARRNGRHEGDVSGWLHYVCRAPYAPGEVVYVKECWRILTLPGRATIGDTRGGHEGWSVLVQYRAGRLPSGCGEPLRVGDDRRRVECPACFRPTFLDAYPSDGKAGRWKSPRFMPEWAARTKLRIVSVQPERLQEITSADAVREGIAPFESYMGAPEEKAAFAVLWNSIHKPPHDWDSDPWVWRVEFEKVPA